MSSDDPAGALVEGGVNGRPLVLIWGLEGPERDPFMTEQIKHAASAMIASWRWSAAVTVLPWKPGRSSAEDAAQTRGVTFARNPS